MHIRWKCVVDVCKERLCLFRLTSAHTPGFSEHIHSLMANALTQSLFVLTIQISTTHCPVCPTNNQQLPLSNDQPTQTTKMTRLTFPVTPMTQSCIIALVTITPFSTESPPSAKPSSISDPPLLSESPSSTSFYTTENNSGQRG